MARLLTGGEFHPALLYYLLSALFSVLNRARSEIKDFHERQFHQRVLGSLLGGAVTVPSKEGPGP